MRREHALCERRAGAEHAADEERWRRGGCIGLTVPQCTREEIGIAAPDDVVEEALVRVAVVPWGARRCAVAARVVGRGVGAPSGLVVAAGIERATERKTEACTRFGR